MKSVIINLFAFVIPAKTGHEVKLFSAIRLIQDVGFLDAGLNPA
jgi:hypothetical protein